MRKNLTVITCMLGIWAASAAGEWPVYQHDNGRTAATDETLDVSHLGLAWSLRCPAAPQYAWHGPSRFDHYHGTGPFANMSEYDRAYYPIAVGGRVYFATTGDDSVYCLDAGSGKVIWTFTADAPIRIAPAFHDGKLYFGSDDGFAYCIRADAGTEVWRFTPKPGEERIFNNGKLISPYPIRSGVLVIDGAAGQATAYFTAGMLPWRQSYFCAIDAATGKPQGAGRYVTEVAARTPEGALAAFKDRIFQPGGRLAGMAFDRSDGKVGGGTGHGGAFLLASADGHLFQAPGRVRGSLSDTPPDKGTAAAGIAGLRLAATKDRLVAVGLWNLSCMEPTLTEQPARKGTVFARKTLWNIQTNTPCGVIIAGGTVFAGGTNRVVAASLADGKVTWSAEVDGRAYGLAVADGRLLVSTGEGVIYCFAGGGKAAEPAKALAEPAKDNKGNKGQENAKPAPLPLTMHPYALYVDRDKAILHWETGKPTPSIVTYAANGHEGRIEDAAAKTVHELTLTGLKIDTVYQYTLRGVIDGQPCHDGPYELDTFFNYAAPALPEAPATFASAAPAGACAATADHALKAAGLDRGVCLVYGSGTGRLAWEIAKRSRMRVIGVDSDPAAVAASRMALLAAGAYGRVTIHHVASLDHLPFVGDFANLVVSERMLTDGACPGAAAEILRVLRPDGGTVVLGRPDAVAGSPIQAALAAFVKNSALPFDITQSPAGVWALARRGLPKGFGVWTHQYGTAANAAYGGEELSGARNCTALTEQWVGRPGPRLQVDRYQRMSAPLSAGGRLFVQGLQRVVCVDAYSGVGLWSLELPAFMRFNVPRDSSNWCANEGRLFLAVDNRCFQVDAATGGTQRYHDVVPPVLHGGDARKDWRWDWGYVACQDGLLIGSAVKAATANKAYAAAWAWYDGRGVPQVCSDNLFALDGNSGKCLWTHGGWPILNSTITAAQGRVWFTEARAPGLLNVNTRRLNAGLWQNRYLVALDLASGKKLWETKMPEMRVAETAYIAYADGMLVTADSDGGDKNYHVRGYDAQSGRQIWQAEPFQAPASHGAHIKRPCIVDGRIMIRSLVLDLKTGRTIKTMPGESCGVISAARYAIIGRRHGCVSLWNVDDDDKTISTWRNLRPGCWLSTIPAAGMVLSPEGGAGCRCNGWIEISVAFKPRSNATEKTK